ncbi:hypothetical protein PoB_000150500 [Plakobranchus ocellatus]|uniref:Uncharacterized protein n=1 Tax=Plakobranchus ocellatus TaxID=259542 RepID=A0AAV3XWL4_9GAST|nr:hypothetical protein PoB_000150500 [Plakobranchus ocellatus]
MERQREVTLQLLVSHKAAEQRVGKRMSKDRQKCHNESVGFFFIASPQQDDFRLPNPPTGHGAGGWARTSHSRVLADLRTDSLSTMQPASCPNGSRDR